MSNASKAAAKIRTILERLTKLTHQLEQELLPDAHEKLMQDFADEADKLEEILNSL